MLRPSAAAGPAATPTGRGGDVGPAAPPDRLVTSVDRYGRILHRASTASLALATAVLAGCDVAIWASDPVIDTGRLSVSLAILVPGLGVLAVGAVTQRRHRPVGALTLLATASLGLTLLSLAAATSLPPSLAAVAALALLTIGVVRAEPVRRAILLASVASLAVVGECVRPQVAPAGYLLAIAVPVLAAAIGVGIYLRWSDGQRRADAHSARVEERLEIARELHDIVGHHLTGIVVQAHAARHVAERRPELTIEALDHIGREGTEALAAMRWMVGTLREQDDPTIRWADIERLVTSATSPGLEVTAAIAEGVPPLPEADAPVVYRVAAESITNARRHGRRVTTIHFAVDATDGWLVVSVVDDGTVGPSAGGGSGLDGLRDRVEGVGGTLVAGPLPEGGWRVRAEIPLGPTA